MSRRLILLLAVAVALFTLAPAVGAGNGNGNFTANLQAENETADVNSNATGQAILKVRGDADNPTLTFKLIVANIDNMTQAHIHCGEEGVDGPPDVFLFGPAFAEPVTTNGILNQGTITAEDFIGNCGWVTVTDLITAIEQGNAYVNVHTVEFPPGEIRGQLG